MLTKDLADKPYPEPAECKENDKNCNFNVTHSCHKCGKPLCSDCAVGIRHQPRLVKYHYEDHRGDEQHVEWHCHDSACLGEHYVDTPRLLGGAAAAFVGLLIIIQGISASLFLGLIGLVLLFGGGYISYMEYRLKNPLNELVTFRDMWTDLPI